MITHSDIIKSWPRRDNRPGLEVLSQDLGVTYGAVRKMKSLNHIPAKHWSAMIKTAARRRIRVQVNGSKYRITFDLLDKTQGSE